jgi:hypothetical protein
MDAEQLKKIKARRARTLAQANGAMFESVFLKMCRLSGVAAQQFPTGCKTIKGRLIRVKTPWDWILSYRGRSAFLDTKCSLDSVFPSSLITPHQIEALMPHERQGIPSGYVIWLRKFDRVFFIKASALEKLMFTGGSFDDTHPEATLLGGIQFDVRQIFALT